MFGRIRCNPFSRNDRRKRRSETTTALGTGPTLRNQGNSIGAEPVLEHLDQGGGARVPVLCLFDHEEVGSGSRSGAMGPVLKSVLERTVLSAGGTGEDVHRAIADGDLVDCDADRLGLLLWASMHGVATLATYAAPVADTLAAEVIDTLLVGLRPSSDDARDRHGDD